MWWQRTARRHAVAIGWRAVAMIAVWWGLGACAYQPSSLCFAIKLTNAYHNVTSTSGSETHGA